jgi:hypothetical protein
MQSETFGRDIKIAFARLETSEPKEMTAVTVATGTLLALIILLGVLFLSGFVSSLMHGSY